MRLTEVADAVVLTMRKAIAPLVDRLETVDGRATQLATELVVVTRALAIVRAELNELKARPPVPGPAGADGAPGRDGDVGPPGPPGKPGAQFAGTYEAGKSYDVGDLVNHDGSGWHCNRPTERRPGDGSGDWTLFVKRGRDAKGSH